MGIEEMINMVAEKSILVVGLVACAWFIYKLVMMFINNSLQREKDNKADSAEREDKLIDALNSNTEKFSGALADLNETIKDNQNITKETQDLIKTVLTDTNKRIENLDEDVHKVLDKLE